MKSLIFEELKLNTIPEHLRRPLSLKGKIAKVCRNSIRDYTHANEWYWEKHERYKEESIKSD